MAPPFLLELMCLTLLVAILVGLGYLIRHRWNARNEPVPVVVAIGSWAIMVVAYVGFAAVLLSFSPEGNPFAGIGGKADLEGAAREGTFVWEEGTEGKALDYRPSGANTVRMDEFPARIRSLAVYGILGLLCVAYYTFLMVNALSQRFVERIDPFSARIEDPSEFSEARKLALRGDIDGAVRVYQDYDDKPAEAHFEAARLLKSHDRFQEAADMLQGITERFYGNHVVWADAAYQLAKLLDNHLGRQDEGAELLRKILERAPTTRFGQLAGNEMARLRVLSGLDGEGGGDGRTAIAKGGAPPAPAAGTRRQYDEPVQVQPRKSYAGEEAAPSADPFFVKRHTTPAEPEDAEAEEAEQNTGDEA